jgi:hypothetical protein
MAKDKRFQAQAAKDATLARRKPKTDARKDANRRANEERAAANRRRRELGVPTPHEVKRLKRREVRDRLRAEGKLPPIGMTRSAWLAAKRKAKA